MKHTIFNSNSNTEILIEKTVNNKISISISDYNNDLCITHCLDNSDVKDLINILSFIDNEQAIITQNELSRLCSEIRNRTDGSRF